MLSLPLPHINTWNPLNDFLYFCQNPTHLFFKLNLPFLFCPSWALVNFIQTSKPVYLIDGFIVV